jgi:hypothetical protein
MRPQGSPAELEQRRLRAIELLQRDLPVHVVADRLGVGGAPSDDGSGHTDDKAAPACARGRPPVDRPSSAPRSAVDSRAWSSRGRKSPAIARACGPVGASST